MSIRRLILRWTQAGALAGLLVPALCLAHAMVSKTGFGSVEGTLWPSSILMLGLDGPTPQRISTACFVYVLAPGTNMLLYAMVGLLCGALHGLVRRVAQ